jgi:hypothetical protein
MSKAGTVFVSGRARSSHHPVGKRYERRRVMLWVFGVL